MNFTERYRKQCNPLGYNLLDVMAGSRGTRRERARYISPTPSPLIAYVLLSAATTLAITITLLVIWKVR